MTGIAIAALVEWSVSNRRLPEEPEDFAAAASNQSIGALPLVGGAISSGMQGWGEPEMLLLKPAAGLGKVLNPDASTEAKVEAMLQTIAITSGLPYTQTKRTLKFLDSGNPMELIGGRPR